MKKIFFVFVLLFSMTVFGQKINNQTVDAACGMCQFKVKSEKGCAVFVKISGNLYPVEGMDKKVFGDAHAEDGDDQLLHPEDSRKGRDVPDDDLAARPQH